MPAQQGAAGSASRPPVEGVRARARIVVMPKHGIADPQGQTVERSLPSLGWANVNDVRVGRHLELVVTSSSLDEASRQVDEMCRRLLANPVIETYSFELDPE